MVIDTMQIWFEYFHDRTNNTHRHETWMDAYLGQWWWWWWWWCTRAFHVDLSGFEWV